MHFLLPPISLLLYEHCRFLCPCFLLFLNLFALKVKLSLGTPHTTWIFLVWRAYVSVVQRQVVVEEEEKREKEEEVVRGRHVKARSRLAREEVTERRHARGSGRTEERCVRREEPVGKGKKR